MDWWHHSALVQQGVRSITSTTPTSRNLAHRKPACLASRPNLRSINPPNLRNPPPLRTHSLCSTRTLHRRSPATPRSLHLVRTLRGAQSLLPRRVRSSSHNQRDTEGAQSSRSSPARRSAQTCLSHCPASHKAANSMRSAHHLRMRMLSSPTSLSALIRTTNPTRRMAL